MLDGTLRLLELAVSQAQRCLVEHVRVDEGSQLVDFIAEVSP